MQIKISIARPHTPAQNHIKSDTREPWRSLGVWRPHLEGDRSSTKRSLDPRPALEVGRKAGFEKQIHHLCQARTAGKVEKLKLFSLVCVQVYTGSTAAAAPEEPSYPDPATACERRRRYSVPCVSACVRYDNTTTTTTYYRP